MATSTLQVVPLLDGARGQLADLDVQTAEEVVDVRVAVRLVVARRLRYLLEVAIQAAQTLHVVELLGRVQHAEL